MDEQNNSEQQQAQQQARQAGEELPYAQPVGQPQEPQAGEQPGPGPSSYSPNRRNPRAAAEAEWQRAQQQNGENAPIPPQGYQTPSDAAPEWNPNYKHTPAGQPQPELPQKLGIAQKAFWFIGGMLFGLIGVIFILILNFGRPKPQRSQALLWALVGFGVGLVIDFVFLSMGGSELMQSAMSVMGGSGSGGAGGAAGSGSSLGSGGIF